MRITIGNIKSKRFMRMMEVTCIEPHAHYDNVLYVQDRFGSFYILTFENHASLVAAMQSLTSDGYATVFCDIDISNIVPTYDTEDYERDYDPYFEEERDYG